MLGPRQVGRMTGELVYESLGLIGQVNVTEQSAVQPLRVEPSILRLEDPPGFESVVGKYVCIFPLKGLQGQGLCQEKGCLGGRLRGRGDLPDLLDDQVSLGCDPLVLKVQGVLFPACDTLEFFGCIQAQSRQGLVVLVPCHHGLAEGQEVGVGPY